jgi:uncharacterized protein (TIGR02996 family)
VLVGLVVFVAANMFGRRDDQAAAAEPEDVEDEVLLAQSRHENRALRERQREAERQLEASYRGWSPAPNGFATFQAQDGEMWLRFERDAELRYMNVSAVVASVRQGNRVHPDPVLQVRAGQLVRVVDANRADDGLGHEPTVRADRCEVYVSDAAAATRVMMHAIPSPEGAGRAFQRIADDVAFWKAMIAAPEDELPRLIYADYLEERGDPAAAIVRGTEPLVLRFWVLEDGPWEERNKRPANWKTVVSDFRTFAMSGGAHIEPGYERLSMRQFIDEGRGIGQWRYLTVSGGSDEPLPPFVNYLLLQLALSLMLKRARPTPTGSVIAENVVAV